MEGPGVRLSHSVHAPSQGFHSQHKFPSVLTAHVRGLWLPRAVTRAVKLLTTVFETLVSTF